MSHPPTSRSGRTGKVTARALRFGLHPTGSPDREADCLVTLAGEDPNVLEAARHRIAGPASDQMRLDVATADLAPDDDLRSMSRAGSVQVDRVRRHAIDVLGLAESRIRTRQAA